MTKYYYLNGDGELERAYPLYYRKGSRFARYSDYFRAGNGLVSGDRVYSDDGENQHILSKIDDMDREEMEIRMKDVDEDGL